MYLRVVGCLVEDGLTYLDVQRREALLHDHCGEKRRALGLVDRVGVYVVGVAIERESQKIHV